MQGKQCLPHPTCISGDQTLYPPVLCVNKSMACSASIKFWVLKTTVTILGEITSEYHKLQGILLLLISVGLFWVVVRNVPYYSSHINCFQGALYSLLTWQALILFALVWEDSWAQVCYPA